MHPRQANLLTDVQTITAKIAAADPVPSGPVLLWKYVDPDGNTFYLETKKTTIRSPFSGKTFPVRPIRYTPAQVSKEIKDERKEQAKVAAEEDDDDLVAYVNRHVARKR